MSLFTKKEILEYQVSKYNEFMIDWKPILRDTNHFIQGIIEDKYIQIEYWLDELVSCYDLEDLNKLN